MITLTHKCPFLYFFFLHLSVCVIFKVNCDNLVNFPKIRRKELLKPQKNMIRVVRITVTPIKCVGHNSPLGSLLTPQYSNLIVAFVHLPPLCFFTLLLPNHVRLNGKQTCSSLSFPFRHPRCAYLEPCPQTLSGHSKLFILIHRHTQIQCIAFPKTPQPP